MSSNDGPNPAQPADLPRLDRCPDCGYLLTGLPEEGICPECGFAYTSDLLVLYGPIGSHRAEASPTGVAWLQRLAVRPAMIPVWILIALALTRVQRAFPALNGPIGLLPLAAMIALWCYWQWRIHREEVPDRWQLRICSRGFAQRQFLGPAPLQPWTADMAVFVGIERWGPLSYMLTHPWKADQRWVTVTIGRLGRRGRAEFLAHVTVPCPAGLAEPLRERVLQWRQVAGGQSAGPPLAAGPAPDGSPHQP